jgi:Predicted metallopeptidase (DUF2201).
MNEATLFSNSEWSEISGNLMRMYSIFYKIWSISSPSFSRSIPTAAVYFDKQGELMDFRINPDFWQDKTMPEKCFILAHECSHILLDHGERIQALTKGKKELAEIANVAADLAVNEMQVKRFGMIRAEIDPQNRYVWLDKISAQIGEELPPDRSMEYYYERLLQANPEGMGQPEGTGETVDDHSAMSDQASGEGGSQGKAPTSGDMLDMLDKSAGISSEELQSLQDVLDGDKEQAEADGHQGSGCGSKAIGEILKFRKIKPKVNNKWETVIKNWANKKMQNDYVDVSQWAFKNRRFTTLSDDLSLPFDYEREEFCPKKTTIKVLFILDSSGSCVQYAERFFKAAASLNPKRFEVELITFDTKVYPANLKDQKIKGGGGTSFVCVNQFIKQKESKREFPDAIFMITDGDTSTKFDPIQPKKAFVFFTKRHVKKSIPPECNMYMLEDYE